MPSRKKKNKSTVASRGPTAMAAFRGTGFEEYYCDPPPTPAEVEEERWGIYAPDVPFEERIQSCLQRFRSRRRLQANYTRFFNEYLFLGGIDTSPNAFAGFSQKELKSMAPAERRDATAVDSVSIDGSGGRFFDGNGENWVVDFTGIASGFLSVTVGPLTGLEEKPLERCISVVENFLRYVLQHDVCPEYEGDVNNALEVCQKARLEWPMIRKLRCALPGRLNQAAAEYLGVQEKVDWACIPYEDSEEDESEDEGAGISAKAMLFCAMALMSDDETFQKLCDSSSIGSLTTRLVRGSARVHAIQRPSEEEEQHFLNLQVNDRSIPPIGKAVFERTTIRDGWDPTDDKDPPPELPKSFHLYIDDRVLKYMAPGMKMNVTLVEVVDIGVYFLKTAGPVLPSFYKFLPQELMRHYKEPREVEKPTKVVIDETEEDDNIARAKAPAVDAENMGGHHAKEEDASREA
ncbi:argonaute siRNA chaperone (ARC) complex subunit arb1 domain-containing protein [Sarocladium implicatum]|nr:argonaute siRNA chaperone (ARC) complex subunit arb1 domain-containing protein [Sarocladium implicatum]